MKIIFLDIDGVLNSLSGSIANKGSYNPDGISKEALGLLRFVVDNTGAKIVISSTWRAFGGHEWFQGLFEGFGWKRPPIIDITRPSKAYEIRGDQINSWLTDSEELIESYVCIDDDSDFYDDQNLVKTSFVSGFQLRNVVECIDILGLNPGIDKKLITDLNKHLDFKNE